MVLQCLCFPYGYEMFVEKNKNELKFFMARKKSSHASQKDWICLHFDENLLEKVVFPSVVGRKIYIQCSPVQKIFV